MEGDSYWWFSVSIGDNKKIRFSSDLRTQGGLPSCPNPPVKDQIFGRCYTKTRRWHTVFCFLVSSFWIVFCGPLSTEIYNRLYSWKGIRHSIYLDDGRTIAETKSGAEDQRTFVYKTLKNSGCILEVEKSDKEILIIPRNTSVSLLTHTAWQFVSKKPNKWRIIQQVLETISHGSKPIPANNWPEFSGK
jgi:hypothetical protein